MAGDCCSRGVRGVGLCPPLQNPVRAPGPPGPAQRPATPSIPVHSTATLKSWKPRPLPAPQKYCGTNPHAEKSPQHSSPARLSPHTPFPERPTQCGCADPPTKATPELDKTCSLPQRSQGCCQATRCQHSQGCSARCLHPAKRHQAPLPLGTKHAPSQHPSPSLPGPLSNT